MDFTSAISLDPKNVLPYARRSRCYVIKKQYQAAANDLTHVITFLKPLADKKLQLGKVYIDRGVYYLGANNFTQAINDFNEAARILSIESAKNPAARDDLAEAYKLLGGAQVLTKQMDAALVSVKKAQSLMGKNDPRLSEIMNDFACIYVFKNDPNRALPFLQQAIKIDPRNYNAVNNVGGIYIEKNDLDHALPYYQQGLKINPASDMAYNNIGMIYTCKGNLIPALQNCNKAVQIDPKNVNAWVNLSSIYILQNNLDEAISCANKAIKLYEQSPTRETADGFGMRAIAYFLLTKYDQAIEDLQKLIHIENSGRKTIVKPLPDPDSGLLAYCLLISKSDAEAAGKIVNKLTKFPANLMINSSYLGKASLEVNKKQFSEAVEDCNTALANSLKERNNMLRMPLEKLFERDIYFVRATAYEGLNDKKNALSDYKHFLELLPEDNKQINPHHLKYKDIALKKISELDNNAPQKTE